MGARFNIWVSNLANISFRYSFVHVFKLQQMIFVNMIFLSKVNSYVFLAPQLIID